MAAEKEPSESNGGRADFRTTHWSVVLKAAQRGAPESQQALEGLCQTYWYPLYAYVRRKGHGHEDAQDLTQSFFASFLESHALSGVDPAKGRFRSLLLASVNHFIANEYKRSRAVKRGGSVQLVSIEADAAARYQEEPATTLTPEKLYDRKYAQALLETVQQKLRAEHCIAGKARQFDLLWPLLDKDHQKDDGYAKAAIELGMRNDAVRAATSRLKRRYRELVREEVARTVPPEELDDEIRHLFNSFGS